MVIVGSACAESQQPNPSREMPTELYTDDDINLYIQTEVKRLSVGYPDIEVSDIKLSKDRTIACGWLHSENQPEMLFMSADDDTRDIERPIGMPNLVSPGDWSNPINVRGQIMIREICSKNGLV